MIKGALEMIISKRCPQSMLNCSQRPVLKETGDSPDKAQWFCFYCGTRYYDDWRGNLKVAKIDEFGKENVRAIWGGIKKEYPTREIRNGAWGDIKAPGLVN
jgi:hypothetical protein